MYILKFSEELFDQNKNEKMKLSLPPDDSIIDV